MSCTLAIIHKTINTTSFDAYANANNGLLRKVRYTARKLVVTDSVLGTIFAVSKYVNMK